MLSNGGEGGGRHCRRTCLILVTKELIKVSIPRLAANVQAYEEFTVILNGGDLLLTFARQILVCKC